MSIDIKINQCIMTNNDCYKAGRIIAPQGIVVHSTGANNPNLSRYVGPDDGVIGPNKYNNHWNRGGSTKCVHAFIGRAKDGTAMIYQTLPWTLRAWGVGSGSNGSYNNSHIQFEICEDGLTDPAYYKEVFTLAEKLCAYLCLKYKLLASSVVGHYEAHAAGYANNHADPRNWQRKHGDSMAAFRARVAALMVAGVDGVDSSPTQAEKPQETPVEVQNEAHETGVTTMNTLRNGSKGVQVMVLQWLLNYRGYNTGKVDGHFGQNTLAAVKAYQKDKKLTADGIVGKNTWSKLLA